MGFSRSKSRAVEDAADDVEAAKASGDPKRIRAARRALNSAMSGTNMGETIEGLTNSALKHTGGKRR